MNMHHCLYYSLSSMWSEYSQMHGWSITVRDCGVSYICVQDMQVRKRCHLNRF